MTALEFLNLFWMEWLASREWAAEKTLGIQLCQYWKAVRDLLSSSRGKEVWKIFSLLSRKRHPTKRDQRNSFDKKAVHKKKLESPTGSWKSVIKLHLSLIHSEHLIFSPHPTSYFQFILMQPLKLHSTLSQDIKKWLKTTFRLLSRWPHCPNISYFCFLTLA